MIIKTKYSINNCVWLKVNGTPQEAKIISVWTFTKPHHHFAETTKIEYMVDVSKTIYSEKDIFKSEQELLNHYKPHD